MRIGFVVNRIEDELPEYSTTRLARAAVGLGYDVYYADIDGFVHSASQRLRAKGTRTTAEGDDYEDFLARVHSSERTKIKVDELDVLMLRTESEVEVEERPWAQTICIEFGQLAQEHGVLVVNNPDSMVQAGSKLYMEVFPPEIRPRTLISHDPDDIASFVESEDGRTVIKPLKGARGQNVFFLEPEDSNTNQIIETVLEHGYAVVQNCVEGVEDGDVRIVMVDGEPLQVDGNYAAFRRKPPEGELRSNMSAGGDAEPVEFTDELRRITDAIGPRLKRDGMFLVGLDVVGDKLIEINAESTGGLGSASLFAGIDFCEPILEKLEKKAVNR